MQKRAIAVTNENNAILAIKGLGQELIDNAEIIVKDDIDNLKDIIIYTEIKPGDVATWNIEKTYNVVLKEDESEEGSIEDEN